LINQVFAAKNKIENIQTTQQQALQRMEEIQQRMQSEQQSAASVRETLASLNENFLALQQNLKLAEQEYSAAETAYNTASEHYNQINLQAAKQQSKIASLQQELSFKQNQLTNLHTQINLNTAQGPEVSVDIQNGEAALATLEKELLAFIHSKETDEKQLNEADQFYYNMRNALQEKENELRHKVKNKEMIEHLLAEIKDKVNELKLQLAGMKERLNVEFRIDLDSIIDEPRETETSLDDLQAASERMKKRLENIGEINPTAIEAYTEMKKRY
jgi:chromosome segregation protein